MPFANTGLDGNHWRKGHFIEHERNILFLDHVSDLGWYGEEADGCFRGWRLGMGDNLETSEPFGNGGKLLATE